MKIGDATAAAIKNLSDFWTCNASLNGAGIVNCNPRSTVEATELASIDNLFSIQVVPRITIKKEVHVTSNVIKLSNSMVRSIFQCLWSECTSIAVRTFRLQIDSISNVHEFPNLLISTEFAFIRDDSWMNEEFLIRQHSRWFVLYSSVTGT